MKQPSLLDPTDQPERRVGMEDTGVSLPPGHWTEYVKRLRADLGEAEENDDLHEDVAFEMTIALGFYRAAALAARVAKIAEHALYTDTTCSKFWVDEVWFSPKPKREEIDLYAVLGWKQSVLLGAWFQRTENLRMIRDWSGTDAT